MSRSAASSNLYPGSAGANRTSGANSFLSKLTSSFAVRHDSQIKHEIELDAPFRQYGPGDKIAGAVHVQTPKPIRATHLIVRLLGFVKVFPQPKFAGQIGTLDDHVLNGSGSGVPSYLGNGCARLVEDELVLCGEGRLMGKYVFRFELLLPKHDIPSSIDFESGAVAYMITSTLTRPTSIAAVLRQEVKINVRDRLDIADVPIPAAQDINVERIKKMKPRLRRTHTVSSSTKQDRALSATGVERSDSQCSTSRYPSAHIDCPPSPATSEMSSANSFVAANSSARDVPATSNTSLEPTRLAQSPVTTDKTIKARTEISSGGFLSGDIISIKVTIEHTKVIKSMQGLFTTLYRLAVIDSDPPLSKGRIPAIQRQSKNRVSSGQSFSFSNLSLTSSNSKRIFRQDLAQSIAPVIIDSSSLTATIRTSLKIPDHLFPTINNVPGSLVSFRYFVENVIDLRGKLGQEKILQKFTMTDVVQHAYGAPKINVIEGPEENTLTSSGGFNYIITDQIRRQKGVISTNVEVIIGTMDSRRTKARIQGSENVSMHPEPERPTETHSVTKLPLRDPPDSNETSLVSDDRGRSPAYIHINPDHDSNPPPIPYEMPPILPDPVDEKERARRAEEALLPSAPPPNENQFIMSTTTLDYRSAAVEGRNSADSLHHDESHPSAAPAYEFSGHRSNLNVGSPLNPAETVAEVEQDTLHGSVQVSSDTRAAPDSSSCRASLSPSPSLRDSTA